MTDVVEGLRATEVEQVSAAQNKDVNQRHRQETALLGSQKGNIGAHILVSSEEVGVSELAALVDTVPRVVNSQPHPINVEANNA